MMPLFMPLRYDFRHARRCLLPIERHILLMHLHVRR